MIGNLPIVRGSILDPIADSLLKARAHPKVGVLILS